MQAQITAKQKSPIWINIFRPKWSDHWRRPDQKSAIVGLIHAMKTLPVEVVSFTDIVEESVTKLSHPTWVPVRKMAQQLLRTLEPATRANSKYFAGNDA